MRGAALGARPLRPRAEAGALPSQQVWAVQAAAAVVPQRALAALGALGRPVLAVLAAEAAELLLLVPVVVPPFERAQASGVVQDFVQAVQAAAVGLAPRPLLSVTVLASAWVSVAMSTRSWTMEASLQVQ
ncbi:MAG: hypothetical protein AAGF13_06590 [Pseudomonadota bacterium]